MDEYVLATDQAEQRFEAAAETATGEARVANDRSDDYELMAILFATVLFFAGAVPAAGVGPRERGDRVEGEIQQDAG